MKKVNKIFKERLTDKLNFKNRYIDLLVINRYHKNIYTLDDINHCLYIHAYEDINIFKFIVFWYKNGKFHRDNGFNDEILPAIKWLNGFNEYYRDGNKIYSSL